MLEIREEILQQLSDTFMSSDLEQGFLLGCKAHLGRLEYCYQIPAVQAGKYFYMPNTEEAEKGIDFWAAHEICFCGFIHSHVVRKNDLSENDIEFAKQLFYAYNLPILWFGLGIVNENSVDFRFYSVTGKWDSDIHIFPIQVLSC